MVPSSFMTSQMTPAGASPARRARSTDALGLAGPHQHAAFARAQRENMSRPRQVAPAGTGDRWPPEWYARGPPPKCRSSPPRRASIDSQNAVPKLEVFRAVMSGSAR